MICIYGKVSETLNHTNLTPNSGKDQEITSEMMMTEIGSDQFPLSIGIETDSTQQCCCCH